MSERIVIEIDTSQLDIALSLLGDVDENIARAARSMGTDAKTLVSRLPTINREMRIILGQVPGMRGAIQTLFQVRRVARGADKFLATSNPLSLYLSLIAVGVILVRNIQQNQRRLERERMKYETLIRRAKGWTHQQFVSGTKEWENYFRSISG